MISKFNMFFALSDMEWELIRINSLLVISELEKATIKEDNHELREKLSLVEFEKHENHFLAEEKIAGLQQTLVLRKRLHHEKNQQISTLQSQLLQSDSVMVGFQLQMNEKILAHRQECLRLAIEHREKMELAQFEKDEIEITLTEQIEDLQKKVNAYEIGLLTSSSNNKLLEGFKSPEEIDPHHALSVDIAYNEKDLVDKPKQISNNGREQCTSSTYERKGFGWKGSVTCEQNTASYVTTGSSQKQFQQTYAICLRGIETSV